MDYNRLHTIGVILLVVIALPAVLHFIIPFTGLGNSYVVLSDSMEPTMSAGDLIFVQDVPAKNVEEGDVVTFRYNPREPTTTHRVIGSRQLDGERAFRTQGDANDNPDPRLVTDKELVGKLVLHIPMYGYIIRFAGSPVGTILFVVVPSLAYIVLEVRSLWIEATAGTTGDNKNNE